MLRLAPIAAILISFSVVGCESLASQSGGAPKAASAAAAAPATAAVDSGHSEFPLIALVTVAGVGFALLQVYAAGELTGNSNGAAGFFGHVMTGGSAIVLRLFNNIVRFLTAEVTNTPRIPVSLITGNPNPKAVYDPRPEPESPVAGLGLDISMQKGLMQDIPSSSERSTPALVAQTLEQPVGAGTNGKS
jgi:hypothetical protein